eukprot:GHVO01026933.1.p1 GENE.GHVO01026933.1~~GHVO01026933.1.p1  ORF type:complete len:237 (+),score=31.38 GHVO01026933.1:24-734(+)
MKKYGNLHVLWESNKNERLLVVGPDWIFSVIIFIIMFGITGVVWFLLLPMVDLWIHPILSALMLTSTIGTFVGTVVSDPGVVRTSDSHDLWTPCVSSDDEEDKTAIPCNKGDAYLDIVSQSVSDPRDIDIALPPNSRPSKVIGAITVPGPPQPGRFCTDCRLRPPYGSVHCDDCGVCIKGFDHHCPWTSKCIGSRNAPIFYAWLIIMALCFVYIMALTADALGNIQQQKGHRTRPI